ncbi:Gfo/Idh/MocA family protein [Candidatus Xianfuyuplasma coldseepsis]|uniref:Gfo/Idh/MocA family oxidoreductase n=1 Tax=Candidatus Xianfuyuplasma coldseepsis TaxID=2782163 RepID=A0A7L7KS38_9MOLU|nr:Gfo/Idh/MocA family oxidoreductase [Xianfuyuplasma coldseepsis]QMS85072.1 Gfo/Idh/MocA family oxidoreductase [Xianfuyuplasma coldseepsis]
MSLGIGIVGCGVIYPFHVEAINQYTNAHIVGIYDLDHEKALSHQEGHNFNVYETLEAMLSDDKIDVIHVLTPHHEHYPITKKALQANKHVFVEKPFTIYHKHAKELVELADRKNKYLSVCFQHRTDKTTALIKDYVTNKTYGNLLGIKGMVHWLRDATYYNQALWRGTWKEEGGGSLINQGIHTLDLMIHIAGTVEHVHGTWMNIDHPYIEVDDNAYLTLDFTSGAKGLFNSTNSFAMSTDVQLEYHFEHAHFYQIGETLYQMNDNELEKVAENTTREGVKSYFGSGHIDIIRQFYDAIIHDNKNYVRGVDTLETSRIIDIVYQS